jgi:hypothetical protein
LAEHNLHLLQQGSVEVATESPLATEHDHDLVISARFGRGRGQDREHLGEGSADRLDHLLLVDQGACELVRLEERKVAHGPEDFLNLAQALQVPVDAAPPCHEPSPAGASATH